MVVGLVAAGCAHVEAPPGGPEDRDPPGILTSRPENEAVVPEYDGPVVFVFDERISERGVQESVMVSPRTSPVVVREGRDEIRVSLREGWAPGQIYHVSLGTEIRDLFGNPLAGVETLVFSTGPEIPGTRASGVVTDRLSGRVRPDMRVEAIRLADSLVYAIPTDSAGAFVIDRIPAGEYQVRAYEDMNQNRSLELFEPRDSSVLTISEGQPVETSLSLLLPDTTPAAVESTVLQARRITIEFDDHLDPAQEVDPARVTMTAPSGTGATVQAVSIGTPPAAPPAAPAPPPPPPAGRADAEPLPSQRLFIQLGDSVRLEPETEYTIRITGLRNINGLTSDVETQVTTPPAPPGTLGFVSRRLPRRYIASPRAGEIRTPYSHPDSSPAPSGETHRRSDGTASKTCLCSGRRAGAGLAITSIARTPERPEPRVSEPAMGERSVLAGLLAGKRGLIVGVANQNSIAWACASLLAEAGMELAFTYQGELMRERVEKTTSSLPDSPKFELDVQRDDQIESVFSSLRDRWGQLDFLLHSIAYAPKAAMAAPFLETNREDFSVALDVSTYSLVALARAAASMMPPGGSILTMTYYGSEKAVPGYNVMGVAKAALEASVRYLAVDLGRQGVRINAISAGAVNTLAARGVAHFRDLLRITAERAPMGRAIEVEEVAKASVFLASDLGSGVTGETIYVDAGFHVTAG